MGNEEKTITISQKEFFGKSMDAILKDKALAGNPMATLMGAAILMTITSALFKDEEGAKENEDVK